MNTTIEVTELQYHDDTSNSHKFYRTWCVNDGISYSYIQQWGRVGTLGQVKRQEFNSASDCLSAADKIVRQKRLKGYDVHLQKTISTTLNTNWSLWDLEKELAGAATVGERYDASKIEWVPKFVINEDIDLVDHLAKKRRKKVTA